jgi:hypothetical protein
MAQPGVHGLNRSRPGCFGSAIFSASSCRFEELEVACYAPSLMPPDAPSLPLRPVLDRDVAGQAQLSPLDRLIPLALTGSPPWASSSCSRGHGGGRSKPHAPLVARSAHVALVILTWAWIAARIGWRAPSIVPGAAMFGVALVICLLVSARTSEDLESVLHYDVGIHAWWMAVGLIRFFGHQPRGRYGVQDGAFEAGEARS